MVIHAHHSVNPVAGDTKRIININADVAGILSSDIVEVEFFPFRSFKNVLRIGKFTLTDKVRKKYYVPCIAHLGIINDVWIFVFLSMLFIRYKPEYYIEEWQLPRFVKSLVKLFSKKTSIILDIHGASPEEYEYVYNNINPGLELLEKHSVHDADKIVCQSDEMKRHLIKKHNLKEDIITVFRCGVDTNVFKYSDLDRETIRRELNISDDELVFVYSGGMHKWQKIEETLKFFMRFHKHNDKSKMMVLTNNVDEMKTVIKDNGLDAIFDCLIIKSLPYKEVPKYLCASDFAFLLRDNVVMNAVASPTKLAEYLACGLPVISSCVAKKWVYEESISHIIDYENVDIAQLDEFKDSKNKKDIIDFAINNLSLEKDRATAKAFFLV